MSPDETDKKYEHGQYTPTFNNPAKKPPEQHLRHLSERLQQTDKGRAQAKRIDRAAARYEQRRIVQEIDRTRAKRWEQCEDLLLRQRAPQPINIPSYVQGRTGRSVRLTDADLKSIRHGVGNVIEANDKRLAANIAADKVKLQCVHLERAIEREAREAKANADKAAREAWEAFSERSQDRPRERFRDAVRGRATHVRDHGHGD